MRAFAVSKMPSYVERVKTTKNLDDFLAKADKFNLPKILLFTNKKNSELKPIYKALSTEFVLSFSFIIPQNECPVFTAFTVCYFLEPGNTTTTD